MRLVSDEVVKEVILNLQKGDLESLNKMKVKVINLDIIIL